MNRSTASTLMVMSLIAGGGMGFGGGRPAFDGLGRLPPRPPSPLDQYPPDPKLQHQPVFTAEQKLSRKKRKAARAARKKNR